MTQLFLEMGNTQLKAALLQKGSYEFLGAAVHHDFAEETLFDLLPLSDIEPTQIFIASVAGSAANEVLN